MISRAFMFVIRVAMWTVFAAAIAFALVALYQMFFTGSPADGPVSGFDYADAKKAAMIGAGIGCVIGIVRRF